MNSKSFLCYKKYNSLRVTCESYIEVIGPKKELIVLFSIDILYRKEGVSIFDTPSFII
jgi:hypothetical protein